MAGEVSPALKGYAPWLTISLVIVLFASLSYGAFRGDGKLYH